MYTLTRTHSTFLSLALVLTRVVAYTLHLRHRVPALFIEDDLLVLLFDLFLALLSLLFLRPLVLHELLHCHHQKIYAHSIFLIWAGFFKVFTNHFAVIFIAFYRVLTVLRGLSRRRCNSDAIFKVNFGAFRRRLALTLQQLLLLYGLPFIHMSVQELLHAVPIVQIYAFDVLFSSIYHVLVVF